MAYCNSVAVSNGSHENVRQGGDSMFLDLQREADEDKSCNFDGQ